MRKHRNKSKSSRNRYRFDGHCSAAKNIITLHHCQQLVQNFKATSSISERENTIRGGEAAAATGTSCFNSVQLVHHLAHVTLTFALLSLFSFFGGTSLFTAALADNLDTSSAETSTTTSSTDFFDSSESAATSSPWIIAPFNSSSSLSSSSSSEFSISISSSLDMHVYNATSYKELELLSEPTQRFMSWLYGLTAAAALFGNIIAVLVLFKGKRMSKGTLRFFLINLALSDINVAAFSIPFTYDDFMKGRWEFWLFFCPVVQCMQITSVFVSVYTLAAIGVDRYVAIIHPLRSTGFSRPFIYISLPAIWVGGFTMGLVQYTKTDAVAFGIAGEPGVVYYDCKELWTAEELQSFTLAIFIITYGLPMAVIAFTYFSIGLRMFNRAAPGNADAGRDRLQKESNNKTLKMLIATVIVFACCWTPMQTLNMFIYYARDYMNSIYESDWSRSIYVFLTFGSHWLSTANSFLNPIVYSGLSENFRHDLKFLTRQLLYKLPCCRPLLGPENGARGNNTGRSGRYGGASTIVGGGGGNRGGGGHSATANGRTSGGDRTMSTRMSSFYPSSGSNSGSLRNGANNGSPRGGGGGGGGGGMAAKIVTSGGESNGTAAGAAATDEGSSSNCSSSSSGSSRRQSATAATTVMYHKSGGNANSSTVQCYQLPSPTTANSTITSEQCNSIGKSISGNGSNGSCKAGSRRYVHQQTTTTTTTAMTAPGSGTEADDPLLVVHGGQSVVMLLREEEGDEGELLNCKVSTETDNDSGGDDIIKSALKAAKVKVPTTSSSESAAHHQSQLSNSSSSSSSPTTIESCSRRAVPGEETQQQLPLESSRTTKSNTTTRPLSVGSGLSSSSSSNSSFSDSAVAVVVVVGAAGPLAPLPPPLTTTAAAAENQNQNQQQKSLITSSSGGSFQTVDGRRLGTPTGAVSAAAAAAATSTGDIHIPIPV